MVRRAPSTEVDAEYLHRLEDAKRASVAQLLFRCARRVDELAVATLELPPGAPRPRRAHTALFPHLDFEGRRLTDLASAVGVTKQAVGPLLDELEEMGVVERIPDPVDGRAKLVRFSAKGREALLHGLTHLKEVEARLAEGIGAKKMRALHDALLALDAHLDDLGA
ncbi:MAG: winged helix DNA-binding protein [Sandaracinus sp.]|nr:winged helix DNA-binding protein [Myxococcales bacterium]MCA9618590.1 winged helix DNA-binding protein [Myxococcales bacterium]MCB9615807.1 winged helix DNA-binding protein [Sandaracinus sp.]